AQVEEDGRIVMYNSIPRWLQRWTLDRNNKVDPQLDFVLTKMSRTPSIQSFATVLDETAHFDADDQPILGGGGGGGGGHRMSFPPASAVAGVAGVGVGVGAGVDVPLSSSSSAPVDIPR
ncbi:hypothetical protein BGZ97_010161, partial [Linnemannia gamsii]